MKAQIFFLGLSEYIQHYNKLLWAVSQNFCFIGRWLWSFVGHPRYISLTSPPSKTRRSIKSHCCPSPLFAVSLVLNLDLHLDGTLLASPCHIKIKSVIMMMKSLIFLYHCYSITNSSILQYRLKVRWVPLVYIVPSGSQGSLVSHVLLILLILHVVAIWCRCENNSPLFETWLSSSKEILRVIAKSFVLAVEN